MRTAGLFTAVLLACCGGSETARTQGPGGPHERPRDPARAIVVTRDAPVPEARDPRERLVYLAAGSVWLMKPDGTDATQLTVRPVDAPDKSPALSPRGDAIAYASLQGGVYRVFVMSLEELVPQAITDGGGGGDGGGDGQPAWSPDGRRIAFMRGDPRVKRDLYVVDASGGEPERLLEGNDNTPEAAGAPVWTPDGSGIVLSADRRQGEGTLLWRYDLATRALSPVTPAKQKAWYVTDENAAFSPDGTTLVFESNRHAQSGDQRGDFDIYSIRPDGSGLTRLTADPGVAREPSYSPDGARIFFSSTRGRENPWESEIYVMAAGGGVARRLTREERPQNRAPFAGLAK